MMKSIFLKILSFICILILFQFCGEATTKENKNESKAIEKKDNLTNPSTSKTKTILCFGNSLTAGYGLDESESWPSLLQNRLDSLKKSYLVINAGLSGETTSNGLNRIDWVLKQPFDLFFLELGANDMLRGLDVNKTQENLEAIIVKVKTKYPNIPIIIAGMMAPPNMGNLYQKKFDAIFPDLAKKYDAILIPFFLNGVAADKNLNLPDGKHPNAKGQKIVLENVWNALLEVI